MPFAHFHVPTTGGAAQDDLNRFLSGHHVVKVEKQFVTDGGESFWAFQVEYSIAAPAVKATPVGVAPKKGTIDYKEKLSEEDFSLYLKLRDWRKARAEAEGKEIYTVFTNAQLAELAQKRPTTLEGVGAIEGVGEGRLENHGAAVLEILAKEK